MMNRSSNKPIANGMGFATLNRVLIAALGWLPVVGLSDWRYRTKETRFLGPESCSEHIEGKLSFEQKTVHRVLSVENQMN